MIPIQWFLNKRINIKRVISCTLSLVLIATPAVLASYTPGDQKPAPPDRKSDGGTTRGCSGGDMPLTVIASRNYVGRTVSGHPTFAWFVPRDSAPKPMQFTIYEWVPGSKPQEVRKTSLSSSPGIMKLSPFSENEPGLQLGKEYLWQVVIHCDPDNPSGDLVSEANIEVVGMPTAVQSKLNKAVNSVQKANIYAEAGLWYNALAEALKLADSSKLGEVGSTLLNELAQWEAPKTTAELPSKERDAIAKQIENLKQIANIAR
ncbi:DUF928 domain-containing protein [Aerosakkonemataceae cyanobacterium BLCC-F50]|uniref:DUF928 domain-containing protein n=1 Tax=Floridaenema flaviceps BLCC-F50 TaxID=3153642 RepID=A0ABV4XUL9_9CYAN